MTSAMRLLLTSDWHGDWVTAGFRRFDDVSRAVDRIVGYAVEHCDAVVFMGDLCNPGREQSHRAVAMLLAAAVYLASKGVTFVAIPGNHDVVEDGSGSHTLLALGAVRSPLVLLLDKPDRVLIRDIAGRKACDLVALPYTPRSHTYDPAAELERLYCLSDRNYPTLIAGHLNIEGIQPGSETKDMARGRDVFFPLAAARRLFPDAVLANGHYHRRQVFDGIHIPGALERLAFGEESNEPGFMVVEF